MDLIRYVEQNSTRDISKFDFFRPGDTIAVTYEIVEGDKKREQTFRGDVVQIKGAGASRTFTVRKISHDVGVERIFPFNCPTIISISNQKRGRVRRARLFYLREQRGKAARIREKKFVNPLDESLKGKKRKLTWAWAEERVKYE